MGRGGLRTGLVALVATAGALTGCRAEIEPDLVRVPAGLLIQGTSESDTIGSVRERPVREVTIDTFLLGRTEVTVGQFRRFVEQTGYVTDAEKGTRVGDGPSPGCFSHRTLTEPSAGWVEGRSWRDPGYPQDDRHPVVCVSWADATQYISWLRSETGRPYRLPTESEFEYAARTHARVAFEPSRTADLCRGANVADSSLRTVFPTWQTTADCEDHHAFSAPVETFRNPGSELSDLAGNVSEWAQDCWHETYDRAPVNGEEWLDAAEGDCTRHVIRGGDFVSRPSVVRAAFRTWIPTGFRTYHVGFRVALTPP